MEEISVRWARVEDLPWITEELKAFSEFYGSHHKLFGDQQYVEELSTRLISDHVFLVAETVAGLVGFIAGFFNSHVYNPKIRVLTCLAWWVPKCHRATAAGKSLVTAFVEHGKKCADWITLSIPDHSPLNQENLVTHGFRHQEHVYLMEVQWP